MRKQLTLLVGFLLISFFTLQAQINNPWVVPEEYKEMINPTEADKSSLSTGKSLYAQHCKNCHGKQGKGDGLTAKTLNALPSDLSLDDLDTQKDGEIYYKTKVGREEMPAFKDLVSEEDIWHLVNYVRTFYVE